MDALSALVASVSHNALASALPGKPPSTNQQQFNGDTHLLNDLYGIEGHANRTDVIPLQAYSSEGCSAADGCN